MRRNFALALPLFALAGVTQASIITGSFQETLDLPDFSSGPRVESRLNVAFPSAGPHLTGADLTSNPSNWENSLEVTFDSTTNILSLTGD